MGTIATYTNPSFVSQQSVDDTQDQAAASYNIVLAETAGQRADYLYKNLNGNFTFNLIPFAASTYPAVALGVLETYRHIVLACDVDPAAGTTAPLTVTMPGSPKAFDRIRFTLNGNRRVQIIGSSYVLADLIFIWLPSPGVWIRFSITDTFGGFNRRYSIRVSASSTPTSTALLAALNTGASVPRDGDIITAGVVGTVERTNFATAGAAELPISYSLILLRDPGTPAASTVGSALASAPGAEGVRATTPNLTDRFFIARETQIVVGGAPTGENFVAQLLCNGTPLLAANRGYDLTFYLLHTRNF